MRMINEHMSHNMVAATYKGAFRCSQLALTTKIKKKCKMARGYYILLVLLQLIPAVQACDKNIINAVEGVIEIKILDCKTDDRTSHTSKISLKAIKNAPAQAREAKTIQSEYGETNGALMLLVDCMQPIRKQLKVKKDQ